MDSKKSTGAGKFGAAAIGIAICVVAAAMLIAARRSSQTDMTAADSQTQTAMLQPAMPNSKTAPVKVQARKNGAATTVPANSAATPMIAGAPALEPSKAEETMMVTVTGCLEQEKDQTFRLKDTEGINAPKSRSWKSGFIKKSSSTIEVTDSSNRLRLGSQAGHRVSVTGVILDKEMQARSLQRVGDTCEN